MINKDLNKYPANFFSEEEVKNVSSVQVLNNYIVVKPLPVISKTNIVTVYKGSDGKLEDKKSTKGVIVSISKQASEQLDVKVGDIVAWSINAIFPKLIEIENETYMALTPSEVFYKI